MKKIPMENISVDEQIVPFKGRSSLKQYNLQKPMKWGYKVFCLAGASGILYDFEIYTGASSQCSELLDIGQSGNVVLRLARIIPDHVNHKIYFDNWFTSSELLLCLEKRQIYSIGTVRANRVPNNKMPFDTEMKKKGRGLNVKKYGTIEEKTLIFIKWQDNKAVNILSSFMGAYPETPITRYDRKLKKEVEVLCPSVVVLYNKSMGGVDKMDALLSLNRTCIRSKNIIWSFTSTLWIYVQ